MYYRDDTMGLSSRFKRVFSGPTQAELDAQEADRLDPTFINERKAVTSVKVQCPFLTGK